MCVTFEADGFEEGARVTLTLKILLVMSGDAIDLGITARISQG